VIESACPGTAGILPASLDHHLILPIPTATEGSHEMLATTRKVSGKNSQL